MKGVITQTINEPKTPSGEVGGTGALISSCTKGGEEDKLLGLQKKRKKRNPACKKRKEGGEKLGKTKGSFCVSRSQKKTSWRMFKNGKAGEPEPGVVGTTPW